MAITKLKINKRFDAAHRNLTKDELAKLEEAIKADGVIDPIIVWRDQIIDGHHRYKICKKLKIDPPIRLRVFADEDEAIEWILRLQLARRNNTPQEIRLMIGQLYNLQKKKHGGSRSKSDDNGDDKSNPEGIVSSNQNDYLKNTPEKQGSNASSDDKKTSGKTQRTKPKTDRTISKIAEETKVSTATVQRSGKYAEAYGKLPTSVKKLIDEKPTLATQTAVLKMANMSVSDLNEAAREVRVGNAKRFDEAIKGKPSAKPASKSSAKSKTTSKAKSGTEISPAKLVDELKRRHFSGKTGLVQSIDAIAKACGGKGKNHKSINESIRKILEVLKDMRKGNG